MMAGLYSEFDEGLQASLSAWCILDKSMRGEFESDGLTISLSIKGVQESLPCTKLQVRLPIRFNGTAIQKKLRALGLTTATCSYYFSSDKQICVVGF
jgi:hypothetical protein